MKRRELVDRIRELKEANRQAFPILSTFPMPVHTHRIETLTIERIFDPMQVRMYGRDDIIAMAERSAGKHLAEALLDRRFVQVVPVDGLEGTGFRYILRAVDPRSI